MFYYQNPDGTNDENHQQFKVRVEAKDDVSDLVKFPSPLVTKMKKSPIKTMVMDQQWRKCANRQLSKLNQSSCSMGQIRSDTRE